MAANVRCVVKDGKNEDETILILESNGALTAEEILLAAREWLFAKVKRLQTVSIVAEGSKNA